MSERVAKAIGQLVLTTVRHYEGEDGCGVSYSPSYGTMLEGIQAIIDREMLDTRAERDKLREEAERLIKLARAATDCGKYFESELERLRPKYNQLRAEVARLKPDVAVSLTEWILARDRRVKLATIEACAKKILTEEFTVPIRSVVSLVRTLDPESIEVPDE